MTIDKAIEILSDSAYAGMTTFTPDLKDATKLGIEALKVVRQERQRSIYSQFNRLPGETDE